MGEEDVDNGRAACGRAKPRLRSLSAGARSTRERIRGPIRLRCFPATWRSGYAAACKAVYTGSIPVVASLDSYRFSFQFALAGRFWPANRRPAGGGRREWRRGRLAERRSGETTEAAQGLSPRRLVRLARLGATCPVERHGDAVTAASRSCGRASSPAVRTACRGPGVPASSQRSWRRRGRAS